MNSILLVTGGSIANNPRLYKELTAASAHGFRCGCVFCTYDGWAKKIEAERMNALQEGSFYPGCFTKQSVGMWLSYSVCTRLARLLLKWHISPLFVRCLADDSRIPAVFHALPSDKYDIVIGHSLAALPVIVHYSKKHHIPCFFDVEDYHPGEGCFPNSPTGRNRVKILKAFLPQLNGWYAASPLIVEAVEKLITGTPAAGKGIFIANCFDRKYFPYCDPPAVGSKIKMVWFSQTIGSDRGLLPLLEAAFKQKELFEITLIGNPQESFCTQLKERFGDMVAVKGVMPEEKLYPELCTHDIGLALENQVSDYNRNICLTNKIYAYLQAGLYILATPTEAQKKFIKEHSESGYLADDFSAALKHIVAEIGKIRDAKKIRHQKNQIFCWNEEQNKLLKYWSDHQ